MALSTIPAFLYLDCLSRSLQEDVSCFHRMEETQEIYTDKKLMAWGSFQSRTESDRATWMGDTVENCVPWVEHLKLDRLCVRRLEADL